jgi:hypothetical protein
MFTIEYFMVSVKQNIQQWGALLASFAVVGDGGLFSAQAGG